MLTADSPWKEVCEKKLTLVFGLLYPRVHAALDWTVDYEALDQELRQFSPASKAGGRIADRLLKVAARGSDDPRFFHLEVQGKKEKGFCRRIHICNLRAEERFNAHVVSLVVLTDTNRKWRPSRYVAGLFPVQEPAAEQPAAPGKKKQRRYLDERTLRFLMVKLIDFRGRETKLEAMDNPMGLFVVAHLEAMRTRKDAKAREEVKLRLIRNLRQRKMDADDTRFWYDCLDWFLQLDKERERVLRDQLERLDREENMPFVNFIERDAMEKGMEKGRGEGILKTLEWYLEEKYGEEGLAWLAARGNISDETQLRQLSKSIFAADTPEKVRDLLVPSTQGAPQP